MSEYAHSWSTEELVDFLEKVDLFEGLPSEDLTRIAGIVRGVSIDRGDVLFEEGEPGDAFYVVFEGAIEIVQSRPDGAEETLAVRRVGEGFGETALLDDAPRSATARALDPSRLAVVPREAFQGLLGDDSLAVRLVRMLSRALRSPGERIASVQKIPDSGWSVPADVLEISRVMQAGLLPRTAPKLEGYEIAAGTTTEESGLGGSVWDWIEIDDGRVALVTLDVSKEGFPAAYHLGVARAVLRSLASQGLRVDQILARANDALSDSAIEGLDQFVEVGFMLADAQGIAWASAGRVPGGIIRREGTFEEFGAHGPPLGMMGGFKYNVQRFPMSVGDTAFVLSHVSPGLFLGAADLMAQLHGKPAGEVVGTLHRAIRKAQGEDRTETSVLYARRH